MDSKKGAVHRAKCIKYLNNFQSAPSEQFLKRKLLPQDTADLSGRDHQAHQTRCQMASYGNRWG